MTLYFTSDSISINFLHAPITHQNLFWILCFITPVPKTTNFCQKRSDRILYDIDLLADTKYVNQRELGSD